MLFLSSFLSSSSLFLLHFRHRPLLLCLPPRPPLHYSVHPADTAGVFIGAFLVPNSDDVDSKVSMHSINAFSSSLLFLISSFFVVVCFLSFILLHSFYFFILFTRSPSFLIFLLPFTYCIFFSLSSNPFFPYVFFFFLCLPYLTLSFLITGDFIRFCS